MYPSILRRVGATLIDLVVLLGTAYLAISGPASASSLGIKFVVVVGLALLYEPVLTAFACTLGQAVFGTRVRDFESLQKITLKRSLLRFLVKYVANVFGGASAGGWDRVHPRIDLRAIHDRAADTVVVDARTTQPGKPRSKDSASLPRGC